MKKLIINADDLGLSRGINRGIIELFKKGAVTSASLMVNMPGFDDAVGLIKGNQNLGVGVHLNVLRGKPVSSIEKVNSLCRDGFFRGSIDGVLRWAYTQRQSLDEFAIELRAQIEKALSAGITITHVDSEKHVHLIGPLFKVVLKVAREYGISKIRCINEFPYLNGRVWGPKALLNRRFLTAWGLSLCSIENKRLAEKGNFRSPDHFYGVSMTGRMDLEGLAGVLSHLEDGTTEIMCHPGFIDEEWQDFPLNREKYSINGQREQEIDILSSPKIIERLHQRDVALITYREL